VLLGVSTQVILNRFSVGLAGHASFNNYVYNNVGSNTGTLRNIQNPLNFIGNASTDYNETSFANNQFLSDYYIQNASFFRLDNINLGYNIGSILKDKASLKINASIQNVLVITKYKGLDPELSDDRGIDNNIYPRPRVYSFGINLDF